jgi:ribosomal protein L1
MTKQSKSTVAKNMRLAFDEMLSRKSEKILDMLTASIEGKQFSTILNAIDQLDEYKRARANFDELVDVIVLGKKIEPEGDK